LTAAAAYVTLRTGMDAAKGAQGCTECSGLDAGQAGFAAHCPHCRRESLFVETRIAHRKHLLLSIVTAGLWLIPWAALIFGRLLRPYRCQACGWHKPEFRITSVAPRAIDPTFTPKKMQPPTVE
jgi:predicted Zn-ribbon and HTH transcriptional regulator